MVQQPPLAAHSATVLSARSGLLFLETTDFIGMVKDLAGAYICKSIRKYNIYIYYDRLYVEFEEHFDLFKGI